MQTDNNWVQQCNKFSIKDLPKKTLITVKESDSIPDVMEKIFSNRILSAPVLTNTNKLIGVVGILDIALFAMNICHSSQELVQFLSLPVDGLGQFTDFDEIKNYLAHDVEVQESLPMDSATFIINYSRQNLLQVLPPTTSFVQLLTALCANHRVAIGDEELEDYITQTDMVKFLKEKNLFGDMGSKTVRELNLGTKNVITIKDNQRVIEAFKKIILNKVSGLAVIDDNSHLVGQVSSSDIKCISNTGEMLNYLYETYTNYKKFMTEKFNVPPQPIVVSHETPFSSVVDSLVSNRVHRVFIVEGEERLLVGIISLTDVLKAYTQMK